MYLTEMNKEKRDLYKSKLTRKIRKKYGENFRKIIAQRYGKVDNSYFRKLMDETGNYIYELQASNYNLDDPEEQKLLDKKVEEIVGEIEQADETNDSWGFDNNGSLVVGSEYDIASDPLFNIVVDKYSKISGFEPITDEGADKAQSDIVENKEEIAIATEAEGIEQDFIHEENESDRTEDKEYEIADTRSEDYLSDFDRYDEENNEEKNYASNEISATEDQIEDDFIIDDIDSSSEELSTDIDDKSLPSENIEKSSEKLTSNQNEHYSSNEISETEDQIEDEFITDDVENISAELPTSTSEV